MLLWADLLVVEESGEQEELACLLKEEGSGEQEEFLVVALA